MHFAIRLKGKNLVSIPLFSDPDNHLNLII